jgi:hypothetical protein
MAPVAIVAAEAARRTKPSNYPELFFSRMTKREKRPLGDLFGLKNFGVNLARPGEARLDGNGSSRTRTEAVLSVSMLYASAYRRSAISRLILSNADIDMSSPLAGEDIESLSTHLAG